VTPQQISSEETKLLKVEESIRIFVRVADPKFRQIVPMRFFNLTLAPAEADACCADFLEEKSLRAGVARVQLRLVALVARMTTELEELKRAQNSPSLWKLHADSLIALLEVSRAVHENGARVLNLAKQRGEKQPCEVLQASMQKLHETTELAVKTLSTIPRQRSAGASAD
jgi:hypothetical protein